jgi:DNA/RNA endonuclease YhcR with UshA esterase domain
MHVQASVVIVYILPWISGITLPTAILVKHCNISVMLEKQERIAVLILLVVLITCGIATWILDNMGKEPFAQNYTPQSSEGSLVKFQGIVQKVISAGSGTQILNIGGIQVFLSSAAGTTLVKEGDLVSLYGKIQNYKGKKEILVSNSADIRVIAESQGRDLRS